MSQELDNWIEICKDCKYLPENDLKKLCDIVCSILLEESNVQPVSTPVTVCGDIHGQVSHPQTTLQQYSTIQLNYFSFMTWKNCLGKVVKFQTPIMCSLVILLIGVITV